MAEEEKLRLEQVAAAAKAEVELERAEKERMQALLRKYTPTLFLNSATQINWVIFRVLTQKAKAHAVLISCQPLYAQYSAQSGFDLFVKDVEKEQSNYLAFLT